MGSVYKLSGVVGGPGGRVVLLAGGWGRVPVWLGLGFGGVGVEISGQDRDKKRWIGSGYGRILVKGAQDGEVLGSGRSVFGRKGQKTSFQPPRTPQC